MLVHITALASLEGSLCLLMLLPNVIPLLEVITHCCTNLIIIPKQIRGKYSMVLLYIYIMHVNRPNRVYIYNVCASIPDIDCLTKQMIIHLINRINPVLLASMQAAWIGQRYYVFYRHCKKLLYSARPGHFQHGSVPGAVSSRVCHKQDSVNITGSNRMSQNNRFYRFLHFVHSYTIWRGAFTIIYYALL